MAARAVVGRRAREAQVGAGPILRQAPTPPTRIPAAPREPRRLGTRFAPGPRDGSALWAPIGFISDCPCFGYTGAPRG